MANRSEAELDEVNYGDMEGSQNTTGKSQLSYNVLRYVNIALKISAISIDHL